MRAVLAALLCLASLAGRAETFKWVDEHGVVNYSNTRPAAKASKLVEDRISTIQSAPLPPMAYGKPAPDYEWLQRQRIMASAKQAMPVDCRYSMDCADPYLASYAYPFLPVIAVRARPIRRVRSFRSFR